MAEHDSSYKLLFSHSQMVADLIRGFVHEAWVAELDFANVEGVSGQRRSVRIAYRHPEANAIAATESDVETRFVVSATVRGAYPSDFLGPSQSRPHRERRLALSLSCAEGVGYGPSRHAVNFLLTFLSSVPCVGITALS